MTQKRIETDSLGPVAVPAERYYGAQTERARQNFDISGLRMPPRFLRALILLKREAALTNADLDVVPKDIAAAISEAADRVLEAGLGDDFPVDVFQTGSGTSTNMNVNEVLSNRAIELLGGVLGSKKPVHPNDHVNASQSSNDAIPTALHVSAYGAIVEDLLPALEILLEALRRKSEELDDVVKVGRTHLQDAVPIRLGQELSGHSQQIENSISRLTSTLPGLAELALGGTAVGTGLNAPPRFAEHVIERLAQTTGYPFVPAANRFEALATRDAAVFTSAALRSLAVSVTKLANDLRWLSSGPRCGLHEITLPSLQPGSSIMPGKVNPVIPEAALMVAAQVIGNDATIALAGLSGNFELNVMMPVIAYNLLQSIAIMARAAERLANLCVTGIEANREYLQQQAEHSLAMATALAPHVGYDQAAEIAKEALESGRTVGDVAVERGVLTAEALRTILDARAMTTGGVVEK